MEIDVTGQPSRKRVILCKRMLRFSSDDGEIWRI